MFDEIQRKLRFELELFALVIAFSLPVSLFLMTDAIIGLVLEQYNLALALLRSFELLFAVMWLLLSTSMYRKINWLRRTHYRIYFLQKSEELDIGQKKSEIAELARNIVGFYRDNYVKFTVIIVFALGISFSILMTATYLLLAGSISFWVGISRWVVPSSILLITSVLYAYIHRGWRRKLLKVKDAEKRLSEMLGGSIEA
jgi:membrane protein implicated in regulation of membrane protease activity